MRITKKNLRKIIAKGSDGPDDGFLDFLGIKCVGSFCEDHIRRRKLNFLKSNWDLLAWDYGYDPKEEFPEIEMQDLMFQDDRFIDIAWDRFIAQVDEFLALFVSSKCESLWMCREMTEDGGDLLRGPVEVESPGDITLIEFGMVQFIRVYDTMGGFLIHCIQNNGEWLVWEFMKVVKG